MAIKVEKYTRYQGPKAKYDAAKHKGVPYYTTDTKEIILNGITYASVGDLQAEITKALPLDAEMSETSEKGVQNKVITKTILDNEKVTAAALNDLNTRIIKLDSDKQDKGDFVTPNMVEQAKKDANTYTDDKIKNLVNGAPEVLDTLKEIADAIQKGDSTAVALAEQIAKEVQDRTNADNLKQDKLTAGKNITLENNIISAPENVSAFVNDAKYVTEAALTTKLEALSTDLKTYIDETNLTGTVE